MKLLTLVCALTLSPFSHALVSEQAPQKESVSKLGTFLSQPSKRYFAKKVEVRRISGGDGHEFFLQAISARDADSPETTYRGIRLTAYANITPSNFASEVTFFDEDELSALIAAIKQIVTDAKPAASVDMGDLGFVKVMETIRVVSREGTEFTYDETLVGKFRVLIGPMSFNVGSKDVLSQIAANLELGLAVLKQL